MLDGIKAEHTQMRGLTDGIFNLRDIEGFQQPQDLDIFLAPTLVHASFQQAPQSLEGRRQYALLQWCRVVERARLLLQQGQIMQWLHHEVSFGITATMVCNALRFVHQLDVNPIDGGAASHGLAYQFPEWRR